MSVPALNLKVLLHEGTGWSSDGDEADVLGVERCQVHFTRCRQTDPEFQLAWRGDAVPDLSALHGRQVTGVELLEWSGPDVASGMVAVSFILGDRRITVHNALDENGLAFTPPEPCYRVHRL